MSTFSANEAKRDLDKLMEYTNQSHEPVLIHGAKFDAVILSGDDWRAIQETLYLNSIPGMRSSIHDGIETPLDKCTNKLN